MISYKEQQERMNFSSKHGLFFPGYGIPQTFKQKRKARISENTASVKKKLKKKVNKKQDIKEPQVEQLISSQTQQIWHNFDADVQHVEHRKYKKKEQWL